MLLSAPPRPRDVPPEPERAPQPSTGSGALIWLVRHGRVDSPKIAYGDDDVTLSEEGLRQTEAVAQSLGGVAVAALASSHLKRALRLGEAIAGTTGAALEVDPRFAEVHRGAWQGLARTEYAVRWARESEAYWRDPLRWQGHGGESEEAVVGRAWPAFERVVERARGGVGVVAAHRQLIRAIAAAAVGIPVGISHALALEPAHGLLLRDASTGWILERTNVAHPGGAYAAEPEGGPPEDVVTQMR